MMKRFLSALFALVLSVSLMTPTFAAEHKAGDTYTRVLASNGVVTVGVRTTYGEYKHVNGAIIRDDSDEFVYTYNGVDWSVAGPASSDLWYGWYDGTQFLVSYTFNSPQPKYRSTDGIQWVEIPYEAGKNYPAIPIGRAELSGYQFLADGSGNVWVENTLGQRARLSEFDALVQRGYLPTHVVAYPVPQGIQVVAYAKYDYTADDSHTYSVQALDDLLANEPLPPSEPEPPAVWSAVPVPFIPRDPMTGCTIAILRAMTEYMGYQTTSDAGATSPAAPLP